MLLMNIITIIIMSEQEFPVPCMELTMIAFCFTKVNI